MAIKYICDRCGGETDDGSKIYHVRLQAIATSRGPYQSHPSSHMKQAMWCENCIVQTVGARPPKEDEPPPPTLEDIIRDLVREEVGEALANREA